MLNKERQAEAEAQQRTTAEVSTSSPNAAKPNVVRRCSKCDGKGWYFVNEWFGNIQGRKDCNCNK